jgi:hypothetical protein
MTIDEKRVAIVAACYSVRQVRIEVNVGSRDLNHVTSWLDVCWEGNRRLDVINGELFRKHFNCELKSILPNSFSS